MNARIREDGAPPRAEQDRLSWGWVLLLITLTFALHAVITDELYGARLQNRWGIASSDAAVLLYPTLGVFAVIAVLLNRSRLLSGNSLLARYSGLLIASIFLTVLSFFLSITVAFNHYGT
jgi:hypothetical protein